MTVNAHEQTSGTAGLASFVQQLESRGVRVRGRKALQKLLMFAQDLGWPTSFQYRLHLFGPYSDEADAIMDLLDADRVLSRNVNGDVIAGDMGDLVAASFQVDGRAKRAVGRVAKLFEQDEPMTLELLATIKFIWDAERAVSRVVVPSAVVKRVARYKGAKFTEEQIRAGVRRLRKASLVN